MPTKAELQDAHSHCQAVLRVATAELHRLNFPAAVQAAEGGLSALHASVAFQRRFQKETPPVTPLVDLILGYAPAFFMIQSLTAVENWYANGTKTERGSIPGIPARIEDANVYFGRAIELWSALSAYPDSILRARTDARGQALLSLWKSAGLVTDCPQEPNAWMRVSDPRRDAVAKCSACGRPRRAALVDFLEPSTCSSCGRRSDFVLVRRGPLK